MQFNDIYRVSPKRYKTTEGEINAFEKEWKTKLPEDFRMFFREFGPGEFINCLDIFWPKKMSEDHKLYLKIMQEAPEYYWEESKLSQKEALESVNVANSAYGDFIVYHPGPNPGFFILPRHSNIIEKFGNKFATVLNWFAHSGVIYTPSKFKWFCTFQDRCCLHIIKDQYIPHADALLILEDAIGKAGHTEYEEVNSTIAFYPQISGFALINTTFSKTTWAIDYDSDFDAKVCEIAEEKFYNQGFREIEHRRPINA